jgi:hypothetical protein
VFLSTDGHNLNVEKESKEYRDIIHIDKIDYYYPNFCKLIVLFFTRR